MTIESDKLAFLIFPAQYGQEEQKFTIYSGDNIIGRRKKADIILDYEFISNNHVIFFLTGRL
jgi:pSer/pThr/pTyr-binding forkhead associated (FHA) protein